MKFGNFILKEYQLKVIFLFQLHYYPLNNSSVSLTNENQILFRWKGLDLDNDIESYDFYIGVQDENLNLEKEDLSTSQISIQLDSNSTYFGKLRQQTKAITVLTLKYLVLKHNSYLPLNYS